MAILAVLVVLSVILMMPLLGVLLGAFSGFVVGLFFEETMLGLFAALGIKGFAMWQIGAFLGFVGGFFRGVTSSHKN